MLTKGTVNQLITEVFVGQPLALPGSVNKGFALIIVFPPSYLHGMSTIQVMARKGFINNSKNVGGKK